MAVRAAAQCQALGHGSSGRGRRGSPDAAAERHNVRVARILLGVTGGIAAYKACELTRLLVTDGHDVIPLVTRGA